MNLNQQNQIESYLAGEMSPEEASAFESLLEVNPELRQELQFQTEVISGIGEVRKAQLLARLDAIEVSAGWWSVVQNSTVMQFVGGAIAVIGIGSAAYWFVSNPSQESNDGRGIVVDAPEYQAGSWDFPEILPEKEEKEQEVLDSKSVISDTEEVTEKPVEEVSKSFNPTVAVPSAGDVEAEKDFIPQEAPTPEEVETANVEKTLEVEIAEPIASQIRYRYYGGKLYLYGNFQEEPYQILEINSNQGRRIYLYHLETFYAISSTDKPVGLHKVTDEKLIKELSILRNSK